MVKNIQKSDTDEPNVDVLQEQQLMRRHPSKPKKENDSKKVFAAAN